MLNLAFSFLCGQFAKEDEAIPRARKTLQEMFPTVEEDQVNLTLEKAAELEKTSRDYGERCRLGLMTESEARQELNERFSDFPPQMLEHAIAHGYFTGRWLLFCRKNDLRVESYKTCPLCRKEYESPRCPSCGLWWLRPGGLPKTAKNQRSASSESLDLTLREYQSPLAYLFPLFFVFIGFGINFLTVINLLANPSWWPGWLLLLIGLPVGGGIGMIFLMTFIKTMSRSIEPAELQGDQSFLRMKIWNTWTEPIFKEFHRIEAQLPTDQLEGIEIRKGQGGESMLFLLHTSGLAFGTGWSGSERRAEKFAEKILNWLAAQKGVQNKGDQSM